jgi:hypothetical protein
VNTPAPPGDRTGWTGWLRWLGFQSDQTPKRSYDVQQVAVVSIESDLTSFNPGPRALFGATAVAQAATFLAVRVIAGSHGCRVFIDLQSGTGDTYVFRTFDSLASAEAVAPISAAAAPAAVAVPLYLNDASKALFGSYVQIGKTVVNFAATAVMPTYLVGVATGSSFFHIGGREYEAYLWLAPGNVLHVAQATAAVPTYISGYLEEPGSARR